MGRKSKIVVIDSGIKRYPEFPFDKIDGCSIVRGPEGEFKISEEYEDPVGHGTAVVDLLLKKVQYIESIFCVKIFEDAGEIEMDTLMEALRYVYRSVDCNMLVIASGITFCERCGELSEIIDRLYHKGVCILSAFDNEGSISFPAVLDSVIGVAIAQGGEDKVKIAVNSKVDVIVPEHYYRVRWVSPPKIVIGGSSFAVPSIAAHLIEILYESAPTDPMLDKRYLLIRLAEKLGIKYDSYETAISTWEKGSAFVKKIKKAIVFPWNKEIHSLARFHELLSFHIAGFFDVKYNLNIGKPIGSGTYRTTIYNIDRLNWSADFDTVILGHCQELAVYCKRDFIQEIVDKCVKNHKRLYAFDPQVYEYITLSQIQIDCFVPGIDKIDIPKMLGGRLYNRLTPVVGVMGTSSRQGKFTVQMGLREKFIKEGYNVGQITSEPSGYLFGCDAVFPFGYNANVSASAEDSVAVLNQMVWDACACNTKDVVIVGGQSGSVPYSHGNLSQYNFYGYDFLCGTNPDVFVLCVNPHDSVDYIIRTIKYLESFYGMPVASIVVFPLKYEAKTQIGYGYSQRKISSEEFAEIKQNIWNRTDIPVYLLGEADSIDHIYQDILCVLGE